MTCTKNLCFSMWMYTVTFNSLLSTPSHTCACISMLLVVHSSHIRTHTLTPDLNTVNIRIQVDIPKLVYFMNMKVFFSWSWERMIPNNQNCHLPNHDHNSNMLRMINSNRNNHCSLFTLTMDNSIQMVYNTITYRITEMYTGRKWFLLQSL